MAKKSQRRSVRYEKDHLGCMWGLINIFDFRHGRPTWKLISDRRHGSKQAVGKNSELFNFLLEVLLETLGFSSYLSQFLQAEMISGVIVFLDILQTWLVS